MDALGHIVSLGAFIPRLRLPRATIAEAMGWLGPPARKPDGARAVCNWDEDALTLAVEAARSALAVAGGAPREAIGALYLASTTLPFADRSNAALAATALSLGETLETVEVAGSLRAGTSALAAACRRSARGQTLVIASDARRAQPGSAQELEFGAAAAACIVASADDRPAAPVATVLAASHLSADFVDHYRMQGEVFDYAFEERWVRDEGLTKLVPRAVGELLQAARLAPQDVQHAVVPGPPSVAKRTLEACGLGHAQVQGSLRADCGDAGCAQPLLALAAALESARPGERVLVVGFGQGVDALLIRAERQAAQAQPVSKALARRSEEASYLRHLSHEGLLEVAFGMRAERDHRSAQSVAWRKRHEVTGFVGGRCSACGTVQFPRTHVCVNPECRRADTQAEHRLADSTGRVKSFTEDWLAYSPRPPYIYGNIEFEDGGNLLMELTDLEPGELAVGARVRFVFRIKDVDDARRFRRYFWKATPN